MENKPHSQHEYGLKWLQNIAAFLAPFVLVAIGAMFTWMQKIDDRQYSMKDEYLSKGDFHIVVGRLETSINIRLGTLEKSLDSQQAATTAQNEQIIKQLQSTNEKLNFLAVELEKKTKKG